MAFFVKTPAVAQEVAETSRATSSAPPDFKPAARAAAVNPSGVVAEPSGSSCTLAVTSAKIAALGRLCNAPGFLIIAQPSRRVPFDVGPFLELRRIRRTRAPALQRRTIRRGHRDAP